MDTKNSLTDVRRTPQQEQPQPPEEYRDDLSPNRMAGQNVGPASAHQPPDTRTAYDHKEVHRTLDGFTDDELKQIPLLSEGARLQQGATYVDLGAAAREPFRALGGQQSHPGSAIVAKDSVPFWLWNRLVGEEKPGRQG